MHILMTRLIAATALTLSLAGCVPDAGLMDASAQKPAMALVAPVVDDGHYAAENDGEFVVPAVPTEKVPAQFQRQVVDYASEETPGTVIISPGAKQLYLITAKGKAIRYGISVGKAGFEWAGVAQITNRRNWPTWTPPPEMIDRKPELAKWEKGQPGGPTNPLGARALYLTTNGVDYGYRIHGTPDWWSIGKNASSGCIRMINQDVMDLYQRVQDGAKVVVLNADGSYPKGLKLPPKPPAKKKPAEAAPVLVTAPSIIIPKPAVMPVPVITTGTTAPAVEAAPVVAPAQSAPAPAADTPDTAAPAVVCSTPLVNGVCPA